MSQTFPFSPPTLVVWDSHVLHLRLYSYYEHFHQWPNPHLNETMQFLYSSIFREENREKN